jgi:hypothetical protein
MGFRQVKLVWNLPGIALASRNISSLAQEELTAFGQVSGYPYWRALFYHRQRAQFEGY